MQMTRLKKSLSLSVCTVLIAATALLATGCNGNKNTQDTPATDTTVSQTEATILGEGATEFSFAVVDYDGNQTSYQINTDKKTVGDALKELELIAGDEGENGLYVKTVCGITADYDNDGKYWAFYVNGEYALKGVDSTEIEANASYSFKVE